MSGCAGESLGLVFALVAQRSPHRDGQGGHDVAGVAHVLGLH